MIDPAHRSRRPMARAEAPPPSSAPDPAHTETTTCTVPKPALPKMAAVEPILCQHCGRTASNGISCIGMCVADSGY